MANSGLPDCHLLHLSHLSHHHKPQLGPKRALYGFVASALSVGEKCAQMAILEGISVKDAYQISSPLTVSLIIGTFGKLL